MELQGFYVGRICPGKTSTFNPPYTKSLQRVDVSRRDKVLITGMGPVGMAAGLLVKAMGATHVVGVDIAEPRLNFSKEVQAVDDIVVSDDQALTRLRDMTDGEGFEVSIDCSGSPAARHLALEGTRRWGRCAMVGEGNIINFDVSHLLIHRQITMYGSWVTSLGHIEDLVERLARWNLHPEVTVSHRFTLDQAEEAYKIADAGQSGKVCIVME